MKFTQIKDRKHRNNFFLFEKKIKALKFITQNQSFSLAVRWKAMLILSELANCSKIKINNRCFQTGRRKGFVRFTGLSRIKMRELCRDGKLPFIRKASW